MGYIHWVIYSTVLARILIIPAIFVTYNPIYGIYNPIQNNGDLMVI